MTLDTLDLAFDRLLDRLDKKAGRVLSVSELVKQMDSLVDVQEHDEGGEA